MRPKKQRIVMGILALVMVAALILPMLATVVPLGGGRYETVVE